MTAATAALSLPRVKAPAPAKPSLPAGLPQLRPFGFQPKFKFTSSVDKVQSQTSSQAASFVRPDVPPVETEQSPRQQFAPAAGAQPRPHGRSALEQAAFVTNTKLFDARDSKKSGAFKLGFFGL